MADNSNNPVPENFSESAAFEDESMGSMDEEPVIRPDSFSSTVGPQFSAFNYMFGQRESFNFASEGSSTISFGSPSFPPQRLTTGSCSLSAQSNASDPVTLQSRPFTDSAAGKDSNITGWGKSTLEPSNPGQNRVDLEQGATQGYLQLLRAGSKDSNGNGANEAKLGEIKTTPLFSQQVRLALRAGIMQDLGQDDDPFPQFGLLGLREETYNSIHAGVPKTLPVGHNMVFANMNAPWSTFICGLQGAGKSHSLSCLLENALLNNSSAGVNPKPLAGLVFHFDKFTSSNSTQLCEAAYLCSSGVPVRVLVSPSNYHAMNILYRNLPGLPMGCPKPEVIPLRFREQQLNVTRMMTLMAVNEGGQSPLYLEVLYKILRDMSRENKGSGGLDYIDFKSRLGKQGFSTGQNRPLRLRLALLEEFLVDRQQSTQSGNILDSVFRSAEGSLTIVDLSCPFVNENDACALFNICLSIFMENRGDCGRILAMDEAHKFLTKSGEAEKLTEELISLIRQQRHLATRVVIATQEPTLSPSLLDLCNLSIVHRFNSPAWFQILEEHLAGARLSSDSKKIELFEAIVGLRTGEALIFCPSALLDVDGNDNEVDSLKDGFIKATIRSRVTVDGGRSIMSSDRTKVIAAEEPVIEELLRPFTAPRKSIFQSAQRSAQGQGAASLQTRTAMFTSPAASTTTDIQNRPITRSKARARAPESGATPTAASPTLGSVDQSRIAAFLETEVTRSLLQNPRCLNYQSVRQAAANTAGLPFAHFSGNQSKNIIRQQMKKHVKAYGIPKPTTK
ncbi:hypothetical protein A1O1_05916 [Capronia coronata CBS 617.96]|uniref:AAA+ ATPase domain-containing protein n=1 Tax=Capronia coronata CBS 617.96 TaxID=1182541 RepID=W9XYD8_9EURO|nr:uncharacterized protein A1O1_05916 [Capronia coronata CBS 617.96]EXJ85552.1 hypothetical protein A1O1_05916 [Capronia coronata CBS 617.96]